MFRLMTITACLSPAALFAQTPELPQHASLFAIAEFWLAIATVAMLITLYAVHRIVSRR